MASADLAFSWKNHFGDPSHVLDKRNSQRDGRTPDFMHNQSRDPVDMDSWHNLLWVNKDLKTESAQDGEFCIWKGACEHKRRIQEFLDRPAIFDLIKSSSKQKDLLQGSRLHADLVKRRLLKNDITLGNALLSMYANCGALTRAQEVFDQLSERNVITWNALIAAYVQCGLSREALSCFDRMQKEGLSPNTVTFVSSLKACGSLGALEKGEQMHADISRRGLLEDEIVLGTALVDMYVKCGALGKAQGVFNMLSARNIITWNVLLAGYAQYAGGDEVMSCFEQMQDEGLAPDAVTFLSILKVCGSMGAADKGEEIHEEITRQGLLAKSSALGNALVDMYAKCGRLVKAKEVFDKLPTRSVVSWNSLLNGYVHYGQCEESISCFGQIKDDGLSPDAVTYMCILKACARIGAAKKGEQIHKEVDRKGLLVKDNVLGNALIDMYAKCGFLEKAQAIFDKLPVRDVVSWNTLIDGYGHHGLIGEALSYLVQMRDVGLSPDPVTFACILKSCGSIGALEKGKEIHAEIDRYGLLEKDIVLGNALVDMYAKCGELEKAQNVFDKLPARDMVTWNVLITGYAEHGLDEKALSCFRRMQDEGLSPNTVTFLCILKACSSLGPEKVEEIHAEIDRQGLLAKHIVIGNALVDMYAKRGELTKAQEVFEKLPTRNVVTWNTLISGYALQGHSDEAIACFERMQGEGSVPDSVTFLCILKACGSLGAAEKGEEICAMVNRQGLLEKNSLLSTALVDMYAKCGTIAKAQAVFNKVPKRDTVTWNALLSGYAQVGDNMVFTSFSRMIEGSIEPDIVTFISLLTACSHAGLVEEGQMYFHIMSTVYSIIPTLEHCTCMVDIFGRAGQFDKAVSMIKKLPSSDCLLLWSSLMGACQNWVLAELGRWAFEHVIQLDDSSDAAYVCMRNTYTAADKREDVNDVPRLKKLMYRET